jgi:hypothetical protein
MKSLELRLTGMQRRTVSFSLLHEKAAIYGAGFASNIAAVFLFLLFLRSVFFLGSFFCARRTV